jgi:hypothetical protein
MTVAWCSDVTAGLVYGPSARTQFEFFRDNLGDTFIDFESVPNGPLTTGISGLTFRTTYGRFGALGPLDLPVAVVPWDFVTSVPSNRIIGTRTGPPRYIPDGQNRYEIVFATPQRRVGIFRPWNTNSLTRFYNGAAGDMLLAQHQNTVNQEFVGYISDSNNPADWITRIELDGLQDNGGTYQVGWSDDLFFGSAPAQQVVPEPSSFVLLGLGAVGLFLARRRNEAAPADEA